MEPPEDVDSAWKLAKEIILRWGSPVSGEAKIFHDDRFKIDQYLQAVDEIQRRTELATISEDQREANSAMIQIAIDRLEGEFRIILISLNSPTAINSRTGSSSATSSVTDSTTGYEDYNYTSYGANIKEAIDDLRNIAQRMNCAGYLHKCVKTYKTVRKSFLDASFRRLGIRKLGIDDVHRLEWGELEAKITRWIRAAKICIRVLFASEKRLFEKIFEGLVTVTGEACFMEAIKDCAIQLFNFIEALTSSRRSPSRLFKILDVYRTFSVLLPDVDVIFQSKSLESIRIQAARILPSVAEMARGMLWEFENAVLHELSNVVDRRGRIHPLTGYVVNYIIQISSYKETLTKLILSKPSKDCDTTGPDMEFSELAGRTPLSAHLIWIIDILQFNLKNKSKYYEDTSLGKLFMMNNVHYIAEKIETCVVLREMIGENHIEKLTENVRQATIDYQRSTWDGIFHCLRDDEAQHVSRSFPFTFGLSKKSMRDRLKSFNATFQEVHRTQMTWLVLDLQLREELRLSILQELIPAYRSFLARFDSHLGSGKRREAYIKFSAQDLETALSNFFEGHPIYQVRDLRKFH